MRVFDLDAQCNASETLCCGPSDLDPSQPTVWNLIKGENTLDEVTLQACKWEGQKPGDWDSEVDGEWVDEYTEIPNLYIVPGSPEMKNCEAMMANEPHTFQWFWELISRYHGGQLVAEPNEVWLLDLPANFGRITVSILFGMDEDDEVLPPALVTGKEEGALDKMINIELPEVVNKYKSRLAPARPHIHHILLCATPTSTHKGLEYTRTVGAIEEKYGDKLLPYVRFSTVLTGQYTQRCPVAITDPNSRPSKDYRDVADSLGFPDLVPDGG